MHKLIDVYLASPYTHPDPEVKHLRFVQASQAAAVMMKRGCVVFGPIAMTHPMALYGDVQGAWETWKRFDEVFVKLCNELWVLMLDGWDRSTGVGAEIQIARNNLIPVTYVDPVFQEGKIVDVLPRVHTDDWC